MARERPEAEIAACKAGDAECNERARRERLRADGARSPSETSRKGGRSPAPRAFFGVASRPRT